MGTTQADKYVGGLIVDIKRRSQDPEFLTRKESRLARRPKLDPERVRSFLYEKHYRCYFHFDDDVLLVLSVLHHARDQKKAFREISEEYKQYS